MKRKDDDLLRLAFGELSADAARAVEAKADAVDRDEIQAFRRLREGLDALPTPPPDGLSAERLRAAILDRELKGRRRPFAWAEILFAPIALAAIAAVVVLPRLRSRPDPQFVGLDVPHSGSLKVPTLDFHSVVAENERKPFLFAEPKMAPVAPVQTVRKGDAVRRARRQRSVVQPFEADRLDALVWNPLSDEELGGTASPTIATRRPEPQTIAAPPSAVVEAAPGSAGGTETVVMLSTKRDLETGAPAATEKEAASVLVGG